MRELTEDTMRTLDGAAKYYASVFVADNQDGKFTRKWVMTQFYNFYYKDEFEYLVEAVKGHLGGDALADFEARVAKLPPREDAVFAEYLERYKPAGYTPRKSRKEG